MDVFTFIIILALIITFGEVATKVGIPLSKRLVELMGGGGKRGGPEAPPSPELADAMEALENRLARIEDRLDFLEELKAAPEQRSLSSPNFSHREASGTDLPAAELPRPERDSGD